MYVYVYLKYKNNNKNTTYKMYIIANNSKRSYVLVTEILGILRLAAQRVVLKNQWGVLPWGLKPFKY